MNEWIECFSCTCPKKACTEATAFSSLRVGTDKHCPRHGQRSRIEYHLMPAIIIAAVIIVCALAFGPPWWCVGWFVAGDLFLWWDGLKEWATQGMIDGEKARAMEADLPMRRLEAILRADADCKPSWEDPNHPLYEPPPGDTIEAIRRRGYVNTALMPEERLEAGLKAARGRVKNLTDLRKAATTQDRAAALTARLREAWLQQRALERELSALHKSRKTHAKLAVLGGGVEYEQIETFGGGESYYVNTARPPSAPHPACDCVGCVAYFNNIDRVNLNRVWKQA